MVQTLEQLQLRLEAGLSGFEKEMKRGRRVFDETTRQMERRARAFEDRVAQTGGTVQNRLVPALAALGTYLSAREVLSYADAWARANNALTVAGVVGRDQTEVLGALFSVAQRNGAPLEQLVELYGKLTQAAQDLGADQAQVFQFTSGVAAALRVAGGSAASASGALSQLAQALGGAVVQAQEFNSINDGARPILSAVARGLDEAGGSVSKLRALVIDGRVTSSAFFEAFLKGSQRLETQAATAILTPGQALQKLENAFTKFVGELGTASAIAEPLSFVADNLNLIAKLAATTGAALLAAKLAPTIAAAGIAAQSATVSWALAGTGMFGYTAAASSATVATRTLTAALLANPFTAVATVVAAAATAYWLFGDASESATDETRRLIAELKTVQEEQRKNAGITGEVEQKKRDLSAAIQDLIELQKDEADRSRDVSAAKAAEAAETVRLEIAERRLALAKAQTAAADAQRKLSSDAGASLGGFGLGGSGGGAVSSANQTAEAVRRLTSEIKTLEAAAANAEAKAVELLKLDLDALNSNDEPPGVSERNDERSSRGGRSKASSNDILAQGRAQIESARVEARAMDMAKDSAIAYRFEQELIARAKSQDIPITARLRQEIAALGAEYKAAQSEIEKQKQGEAADGFLAQARARRDAVAVEVEAQKRQGGERARFLFEQELLAQARQQEIEMTPDVVAGISAIAGEYVRLSESLAGLKSREQAAVDGMRELREAGVQALEDLIMNGQSFEDVLKGLAKQLASSALKNLFSGSTGGLAGGLDSFLKTAIFGRASGGPVNARQPYLVGETGPELFIPRGPGRISKGGGGGGGTTAITVNLHGGTGDKVLEMRLTQAVKTAVAISNNQTKRNFGTMLNEHQLRRA